MNERSSSLVVQRARVRLSRSGPATARSHLSQIDVIRKALQESNWPLTLSQSKRPKIKVGFGPAISVGYESQTELFDVSLHSRLSFKEAGGFLQEHLEPGYLVREIKSIPRIFPSLEESVNLAFYEIQSNLLRGTGKKWELFWQTETFPIVKKKADRDVVVDARPCVRKWELKEDLLFLQLRFGPKRTIKPERLIQAVCSLDDNDMDMGRPNQKLKICRTKLFFEKRNKELIEI